jgi:hypothetical protein
LSDGPVNIAWAASGAVGVAMAALYVTARQVWRRRGRVWVVPLGGFFPLAATVASVAAGTAVLVLSNLRVMSGVAAAFTVYAALGLTITYGLRMLRMLREQARDPGELA